MTDEIKDELNLRHLVKTVDFSLDKDQVKSTQTNIGSDKLKAYSIEELQKQIQGTIAHWFKEGKWWVGIFEDDKSGMTLVPANKEQTEQYQAEIRRIKFEIQMRQEAAIVDIELKPRSEGITTELKRDIAKYTPLVSRRKVNQILWSYLGINGKTQVDGELFTFQQKETYSICGCTDEQLDALLQDGIPNTPEDIRTIRQLHSEKLNGQLCSTMYRNFDCENPQEVTKYQAKHSIGNWNCKACLTQGTKIESEEDANSIKPEAKAIDWCPKFIPLLRGKTYEEYLTATGKKKAICYAGLMHSEMSFVDEIVEETMSDVICGCSDTQLSAELFVDGANRVESLTGFKPGLLINTDIEHLRQQHSLRLQGIHNTGAECTNPKEFTHTIKVTKTYVVITKKCDTCGHTIEEKKEYHQPKPIQPGETLQEL